MSDKSQLEQFLTTFHERQPGITSRMVAGLPASSDGEVYSSSYAVLLDTLPARITDSAILDLACGDGYLLSLLDERCDPSCTLVGVDMNAAELRLARHRLAARVTLHQEKAQRLSALNGSFDYVVCHLALMLMESSDQVLAEIRRVLKLGGTISAVVGASDAPSTPLMTVFRELLARHRALPEYSGIRFGDARFGTVAGLRDLLARDFERITCRDIKISHRRDPDGVWDWLLGMYNLHLFDETERELIRREFHPAIASLCDAAGLVTVTEQFRLFSARAA